MGVLTATVRVKVSPEPALLSLVERYTQALRYALGWIIENRETRIARVHRALYSVLKERFKLPSRVAQDCYREAITVAKSWFRNPNRGRRPVIKRKRMWLTLVETST